MANTLPEGLTPLDNGDEALPAGLTPLTEGDTTATQPPPPAAPVPDTSSQALGLAPPPPQAPPQPTAQPEQGGGLSAVGNLIRDQFIEPAANIAGKTLDVVGRATGLQPVEQAGQAMETWAEGAGPPPPQQPVAPGQPDNRGVLKEAEDTFLNTLGPQNTQAMASTLQAVGVALNSPTIKGYGDSLSEVASSADFGQQPSVSSIAQVNGVTSAMKYAANGVAQALGSSAPSFLASAIGMGVGGAAAGPVGATTGVLAGAAGSSYVQNVGDTYQQLIQEGVEEKTAAWAALAAGVPLAALDTLSFDKLAAPLLRPAKEALTKAILQRILQGVKQGAIYEGATESVQQAIQEGTAAWASGNIDLANRFVRVVDAGVMGALGGGVIEGATTASAPAAGAPNYKPQTELHDAAVQRLVASGMQEDQARAYVADQTQKRMSGPNPLPQPTAEAEVFTHVDDITTKPPEQSTQTQPLPTTPSAGTGAVAPVAPTEGDAQPLARPVVAAPGPEHLPGERPAPTHPIEQAVEEAAQQPSDEAAVAHLDHRLLEQGVTAPQDVTQARQRLSERRQQIAAPQAAPAAASARQAPAPAGEPVAQIDNQPVYSARTTGQDGDQYFAPQALDLAREEAANPESRTKLVYMTPDQFLGNAADFGWGGGNRPNSRKLENVSYLQKQGTKFSDLPFLRMADHATQPNTFITTGHEGRHRAVLLKKLGVQQMPVLIQHTTRRWGQEPGVLPRLIVSQEKDAPTEQAGAVPGYENRNVSQMALSARKTAQFRHKPMDLLHFLTATGGVTDEHGHLTGTDAKRFTYPGLGKLLRSTGKRSLDRAREAAAEAGYIAHDSSVADLVAAINENLNGRPVYSPEEQAKADEQTQTHEAESATDRAGPTYEEEATAIPFSARKTKPAPVAGLHAVTRHLTPQERDRVTSRAAQTLVDTFHNLPSAEEMASVAWSGRAKRGWYQRSAKAIHHIFGTHDAPRFTALLAATSPQVSVQVNLHNALRVWRGWTETQRPTDRATILRILGENVLGNKGEESALDAWKDNVVRALSAADGERVQLSGPKVNSFMQNLLDNVDEVTNDAWIANYAGIAQKLFKGATLKREGVAGKGPGYMAMNAVTRRAAEILTKRTGETWTPREVQETVWSWAKALYEGRKAPGEKRSAMRILKEGGLTSEQIDSVPDFELLFVQGVYKTLLEEADYGKELAAVEKGIAGRDEGGDRQRLAVNAFSAEGAGISEAAYRRYLNQAARRLEDLYQQRQADKAATKAGEVSLSARASPDRARSAQYIETLRSAIESYARKITGSNTLKVILRDRMYAEDAAAAAASGAKAGDEVAGSYDRSTNTITLSTSSNVPNPFSTLHHESWHVLKAIGVLTEAEQRALDNSTERMSAAIKDFGVNALGLTSEERESSWMEHEYETRPKIKDAGAFRSGMAKIKKMMRAIRGRLTPEDIADKYFGMTLAKRGQVAAFDQHLNMRRPQLSARVRTVSIDFTGGLAKPVIVSLLENPMPSQLRQMGENGVTAMRWISRGGKFWTWSAGDAIHENVAAALKQARDDKAEWAPAEITDETPTNQLPVLGYFVYAKTQAQFDDVVMGMLPELNEYDDQESAIFDLGGGLFGAGYQVGRWVQSLPPPLDRYFPKAKVAESYSARQRQQLTIANATYAEPDPAKGLYSRLWRGVAALDVKKPMDGNSWRQRFKGMAAAGVKPPEFDWAFVDDLTRWADDNKRPISKPEMLAWISVMTPKLTEVNFGAPTGQQKAEIDRQVAGFAAQKKDANEQYEAQLQLAVQRDSETRRAFETAFNLFAPFGQLSSIKRFRAALNFGGYVDALATAEVYPNNRDGYTRIANEKRLELFSEFPDETHADVRSMVQRLADEALPEHIEIKQSLRDLHGLKHESAEEYRKKLERQLGLKPPKWRKDYGGEPLYTPGEIEGTYRELVMTWEPTADRLIDELPEHIATDALVGKEGGLPADMAGFAMETTSMLNEGFPANGHWGMANVLVWSRFNERMDNQGRRILFIDELQSDWHQQGYDKGYRAMRDNPELRPLRAEMQQLLAEKEKLPVEDATERGRLLRDYFVGAPAVTRLIARQTLEPVASRRGRREPMTFVHRWWQDAKPSARIEFVNAMRTQVEQWKQARYDAHGTGEEELYQNQINEADNLLNKLNVDPTAASRRQEIDARLSQVQREMSQIRSKGPKEGDVSPAPFSRTQDYQLLALKRMIEFAAENEDIQGISWTSGRMQSKRYGNLLNNVTEVRAQKLRRSIADPSAPQEYNLYATTKGQEQRIEVSQTEKQVREVLGKTIADALFSSPLDTENQEYRVEAPPGGWEIGSHGMVEVYDNLLRRVARDYGKRFGAEIGTTEIISRPALDGDEIALNAVRAEEKETVPFLPLTPQMREDVRTHGQPLYSARRMPPGVGTATQHAAQHLMSAPIGNTFAGIMKASVTRGTGNLPQRLRAGFAQAWEAKKIDWHQGWADQRVSLKYAELKVRGKIDYERSPYIHAHLTHELPDQMAMAIGVDEEGKIGGAPYFDHRPGFGVTRTNTKVKTFIAIFRPLALRNLLNHWQLWAAAVRTKNMLAEDAVWNAAHPNAPKPHNRDQLFERLAKDHGMTRDAYIDQIINDAKPYQAEYEKAMKEWTALRGAILDYAEDGGIIDPEARKTWDRDWYIPFYRVVEDISGEMVGSPGRAAQSLANQRSGIKTLRGGEAALNDVIENMVLNMTSLIDRTMKNRAAQFSIPVLHAAGVIEPVPHTWKPIHVEAKEMMDKLNDIGIGTDGISASWNPYLTVFEMVPPMGKDIMSVMIAGKARYYKVKDPVIARAVMAAPRKMMGSMAYWFLGAPKNFFTATVTKTPAFAVRNVLRDTLAAWVQSYEDFGKVKGLAPFVHIPKNMGQALMNSPSKLAIMAAGGGIGSSSGHTSPKAVRKRLQHITDISTPGKALKVVRSMWEKYDRFLAASEQATRIQVYEATLRAGKSHAEAVWAAKDVLNFTMKGDNEVMRWLTMAIPFLNARFQGLHRLARGARANPTSFALRGMLIAATYGLAMAIQGDEPEYQALEQWERDSYFHLWPGMWLPGVFDRNTHIRIPKPFEVGTLFSTWLLEHPWNYSTGTETLGEVGRAMWKEALNQFMAIDTYPIPLAIKPLLELTMNYSLFTGRPIVDPYLENDQTPPNLKYGKKTSSAARLVGQLTSRLPEIFQVAPDKLDYLVRGYMGSIGTTLFQLAGWAARSAGVGNFEPNTEPETLDQLGQVLADPEKLKSLATRFPLLKTFFQKEPYYTRWENEAYDLGNQITKVEKSIKAAQQQGDRELALSLREESKDLMRQKGMVESVTKRLRTLNKQEKQIVANKKMDAETKRKQLDEIQAQQNKVAAQITKTRHPVEPNVFNEWANAIMKGIFGTAPGSKQDLVKAARQANKPALADIVENASDSDFQ